MGLHHCATMACDNIGAMALMLESSSISIPGLSSREHEAGRLSPPSMSAEAFKRDRRRPFSAPRGTIASTPDDRHDDANATRDAVACVRTWSHARRHSSAELASAPAGMIE